MIRSIYRMAGTCVAVAATLLLVACSDDEVAVRPKGAEGFGIGIRVVEANDLAVTLNDGTRAAANGGTAQGTGDEGAAYGTSRAAANGGTARRNGSAGTSFGNSLGISAETAVRRNGNGGAAEFGPQCGENSAAVRRSLSGDTGGRLKGLTVGRLSLPIMGIHPRSVAASGRGVTGAATGRNDGFGGSGNNIGAHASGAGAYTNDGFGTSEGGFGTSEDGFGTSDDDFEGPENGNMGAGAGAARLTRALASDIVTGTENFPDSVMVWGFTKETGTAAGGAATEKTLFGGDLLLRENGWRSHVLWPYGLNGTIKVWAVAPYTDNIEDFSVTNAASVSYGACPTLSYTVPDATDAQRDVLYGESDDIDGSMQRVPNLAQDNKVLPVTFRHVLTAVRFALGTIPSGIKVTSIHINGVYNQGNYDGKDWSAQTGMGMYALKTGGGGGAYSLGAVSGSYCDDGQVMFLLPQTTPSSAQLVLEIEETATEKDPVSGESVASEKHHTVRCTIDGDVWQQGYTVTYVLTVGRLNENFYFFVEQDSKNAHTVTEAFEHDTNTQPEQSVRVHSYRLRHDYSSGALVADETNTWDWSIAGYVVPKAPTGADYNGNDEYAYEQPDEMAELKDQFTEPVPSLIKLERPTNGDTEQVVYQFRPQAAKTTVDHTAALTGMTVREGNYHDLSHYYANGQQHTGGRESANSYVVNARGFFAFPMVYGNAYHNGRLRNNTDPNLKDHRAGAITRGSIKEQMKTYHFQKSTSGYKGTEIWDTNGEPFEENIMDANGDVTATRHFYCMEKDSAFTAQDYGDYKAELLWKDDKNLNISAITAGVDLVTFTVDMTGDLPPSNAVIGLKARVNTEETQYTCKDKIYVEKNDVTGTWEKTGTVVSVKMETTGTGVTATTTHYPIEESKKTTNGDYEWLWQWHIFVTDQWRESLAPFAVRDVATGSNDKNMMAVNLGWVPDKNSEESYAPRHVWVKLEQDRSAQSAWVHLVQHGRQPLATGRVTYYRWGHPEAVPRMDNTNAPLYDVDGNEIVNLADIPTPMTWANGGSWGTAKTLYDPCPPGYRVPTQTEMAFVHLTGADDDNTVDASGKVTQNVLNRWPDATTPTGGTATSGGASEGAYFYATPHTYDAGSPTWGIPASDRYAPTVYLPATNALTADTWKHTDRDPRIQYWLSDSERNSVCIAPDYTYASQVYRNETVAADQGTDGVLLSVRPVAE